MANYCMYVFKVIRSAHAVLRKSGFSCDDNLLFPHVLRISANIWQWGYNSTNKLLIGANHLDICLFDNDWTCTSEKANLNHFEIWDVEGLLILNVSTEILHQRVSILFCLFGKILNLTYTEYGAFRFLHMHASSSKSIVESNTNRAQCLFRWSARGVMQSWPVLQTEMCSKPSTSRRRWYQVSDYWKRTLLYVELTIQTWCLFI